MNTVSLKVNEKSLIKNLGLAFSNSYTVVTELAQNARRARATEVLIDYDTNAETLFVSDDGHGIDDFAKLFEVAESGWSDSVQKVEKAFGMGFLSALYAAKRITIKSKGKILVADTDDLLQFKSIAVEEYKTADRGVSLILEGVKIDEKHFRPEYLFRGFPLRVIFNGQEVERNHAVEGELTFIKTDVGLCSFKGFEREQFYRNLSESTILYYQGFPVAQTGIKSDGFREYGHCFEKHHNICHLDEKKYDCRLPDRDTLINQNQVVSDFAEVFIREWKLRIQYLKSILTGDDFVKWHPVIKRFGMLELLNDIDILPFDAVHTVEEYPVHRSNKECTQTAPYGEYLTRSKVESDEVIVLEKLEPISPDYVGEDQDARLWMAVYLSDNIVSLEADLHCDHWIYNHVVKYSDVRVSYVNSCKPGISGDDGLWDMSVSFCDQISLEVPQHDLIEINDDAVVLEGDCGLSLFVPDGCSDGAGVLQAQSFTDEYDVFQEESFERSQEKLECFIQNERLASNPVQLLRNLLADKILSAFPTLLGKEFQVLIGPDGQLDIKEI